MRVSIKCHGNTAIDVQTFDSKSQMPVSRLEDKLRQFSLDQGGGWAIIPESCQAWLKMQSTVLLHMSVGMSLHCSGFNFKPG